MTIINRSDSKLEVLNGESIDYQFYDDQARLLRSSMFMKTIKDVIRRVNLNWKTIGFPYQRCSENQLTTIEEVGMANLTIFASIKGNADKMSLLKDELEKLIDNVSADEHYLQCELR